MRKISVVVSALALAVGLGLTSLPDPAFAQGGVTAAQQATVRTIVNNALNARKDVVEAVANAVKDDPSLAAAFVQLASMMPSQAADIGEGLGRAVLTLQQRAASSTGNAAEAALRGALAVADAINNAPDNVKTTLSTSFQTISGQTVASVIANGGAGPAGGGGTGGGGGSGAGGTAGGASGGSGGGGGGGGGGNIVSPSR